MPLNGSQMKLLQGALLSAFPTQAALARLARFELDVSIETIATGNLADVAEQLVIWVDAEERIPELITKARQQNKGNVALRDAAESLLKPGVLNKSDSDDGARSPGRIKVLFVSANPVGTQRLALDEEIRAITSKIRAAEHRDLIELVSCWATRPDDLMQALSEHKPHVVQFSAHGSPTEEIILLDSEGKMKPVSKAALESLFRTFKDNIQLVLLNACYSLPQAEAITSVIDCAIGMNKAIGDKTAITFSSSFYRALGFGRSVQQAFDQGITALEMEGLKGAAIPELKVRAGVDPGSLILVGHKA